MGGRALKTLRQEIVPLIILLGVGLVCYANSFRNDFVWDDYQQIIYNPLLRSWASAPGFFTTDSIAAYGVTSSKDVKFYRPLWLLLGLGEYQAWGANALDFHLFNFLMHAVNGLLFYSILRVLSVRRSFALLAAALFLCHPALVETTAFIANDGTLLCVFFMLISTLGFLKFLRGDNLGWMTLGISTVAYGLALLTKEIAVTLPGMLLGAALLLPGGRKRIGREWLTVAAAYGLITVTYLAVRSHVLMYAIYPSVFSWAKRGVLALRALAGYFGLAVAPVTLYPEKTVALSGLQGTLLTLAGATVVVGLIATAIWFWMKEARVALGLVWFAAGFSLVSNIVTVSPTFAERWLYWPLLGLLLAAAAWWEHATLNKQTKTLPVQVGGWLVVALFAVMTISQNRMWRNDVVLYETTIARGGDSVRMRSNLALAYLVDQDFNKAQTEFEEVLRRDPHSPIALRGMGRLLATEHQYAPAAHWLEQALAVEPGDGQASIWLAYVQEQLGNLHDAEQTLRAAMAQTITAAPSLKLADFLQRHGRLDEAGHILRDVLWTDPLNAAAHNSLGTVLFKKGDVAGAEEQFHLSLRYDRWMVDAHANLAAVAGARKDWAGALGQYQDALALSPSNADLYYAMGVMLTRSGDASAGSRALVRAAELDPELEQAVRQFLNEPK